MVPHPNTFIFNTMTFLPDSSSLHCGTTSQHYDFLPDSRSLHYLISLSARHEQLKVNTPRNKLVALPAHHASSNRPSQPLQFHCVSCMQMNQRRKIIQEQTSK
jgi:hypothetical protein